ncbi:MAG: hypothetical protein ACON35_07600 [Candidatus Marinamargulisbacteria bacterium]
MPFNQYIYLFTFIVATTFSVSAKVSISSFDINTAIKATSQSGNVSKSNVIASSQDGSLDVRGLWFVNSGVSYSDGVVVGRVVFNTFGYDLANGDLSVDDIAMLENTESRLTTEPLFYPNPFRFSNVNKATGKNGGTLYYTLSKAFDMEVQMYDVFGHRIWRKECPANSSCGRGGKNEIDFNKEELNGYEMSAGVYFYLFIHEGKVIGRGKVAVVP